MPRTLLDQAALARSASQVDRLLERAEERDLFDRQAVEALLSRAGGHPGAARLRRALAIYRDPVGVTRSGLERRFTELVTAARLPRPSTNVFVEGFELDAAFERDRVRQGELKLRGIEMVRVTGHRLEREPRAVTERIARLLRQRRRQLGLEPAESAGTLPR